MPNAARLRALSAHDRLIVALDVPSAQEARALVQTIGDAAGIYKIGKQLFTAAGPELVREFVQAGHKIFLDLKFHDIPNTVSSAVRSASELGVHMFTVHASGGSKMLQAAAEAAAATAANPLVLAVTVLTSLSDAELREVGINGTAAEQVIRLGKLAKESGCGGLVCSPQEAGELRKLLGSEMALVTPGVRPAGAESGDQSRVATPAEAIRAGASHIVVGRPITGAASPSAAAAAILREIEGAAIRAV